MNETEVDSKENSYIQPKKKAKYRTPTVRKDRSTLFKRMEHTMQGQIHDDDDDDDEEEEETRM
jgi:hypothetical protein